MTQAAAIKTWNALACAADGDATPLGAVAVAHGAPSYIIGEDGTLEQQEECEQVARFLSGFARDILGEGEDAER